MPLKVVLLLAIPLAVAVFLFVFQYKIAAAFTEGISSSPDYGLAYYVDFVRVIAWEIVWFYVFLLLTGFFFLIVSRYPMADVTSMGARAANGHFVILIFALSLSAALYISFETFDQFPATSQEYAHLFQAKLFSEGKLWQRIHDLPAFFVHDDIVQHDGIEVSRFGPGWPLLLGMAMDLGIPAFVVNPVLALLVLVSIYFFARYRFGQLVAVWSVMALAFTGLFAFHSAGLFSHTLQLLLIVFFVAAVHLYDKTRNVVFGILIGVSFGMLAGVALYNAVLIFIVFAFYFVFHYKLRAIPLFLSIAAGAFPFLALLGFYHYAITGNMFLPVNAWVPADQLAGSERFDWLQAASSIPEWILIAVYWSSPGWLVLIAILLGKNAESPKDRALHPEVYILPVLMVGHLFYREPGDSAYGPGFLFAGFPFLVLFVVNRALSVRSKWPMALLLATVVYGVIKIPVLMSREGRIVDERRDLYTLVKDENVHNAVVLVSSSTSPRRPMRITQLTRNDPGYLGDVIYAVALPEITGQLKEYYHNRTFYRYMRRDDEPRGRLIRLQ